MNEALPLEAPFPHVSTRDLVAPLVALFYSVTRAGRENSVVLREQARPVKGKLTLGFLNVAAYQRFDPAKPSASRFVDEDINRVWSELTLDGTRDSVELRRARQYRSCSLVDFAASFARSARAWDRLASRELLRESLSRSS